MRIGIHSFSYNMSEESPIKRLLDKIKARGHEIVFLDTDSAELNGDSVVFPELPEDGKIDMFVSYLPSCDLVELHEGRELEDVPYYTQLRLLSERFPSPTPYSSHIVTKSKTEMKTMFEKIDVPIPASYDGSNIDDQQKILNEIKNGKEMVFKINFGGSGEGVIKINTEKEAKEAFTEYEGYGTSFLVQEYIDKIKSSEGCDIDYRAIVVGDKVLAGVQRTAQQGEWRTNNSLGSTNSRYNFTSQEEADAVHCLQRANLGFGAVDIIKDQNGNHFICEINDGLDMTQLDSARPDLDLSEAIVIMFEKEYGEPTPFKREFVSANDDTSPDNPRKEITPPPVNYPNYNKD